MNKHKEALAKSPKIIIDFSKALARDTYALLTKKHKPMYPCKYSNQEEHWEKNSPSYRRKNDEK